MCMFVSNLYKLGGNITILLLKRWNKTYFINKGKEILTDDYEQSWFLDFY